MANITVVKENRKDNEKFFEKFPNIRRFKDFSEIQESDYIRPLFEDITFIFKKCSIKEYENLKSKEFPEYINIIVIMQKNDYDMIMESISKSEFQIFAQEISKFIISVNPKLLYQLFVRTKGDINKSIDLLNDGVDSISKLNKLIPSSRDIFARDVLITAILSNGYSLPKELFKYQKKRYEKEPAYLTDARKLIFSLGEEYTFNILRKEVRTLYDTKLKYLNENIELNKYNERIISTILLKDIILAKELFDTPIQMPVLWLLDKLYSKEKGGRLDVCI